MSASAEILQPEPHKQEMNIGLKADYRADMATSLSEILAANYHLIIKSHVYHWNVVGPLFKPLHELTEEHYQTLFEAADVIAERIRALGHTAPARISKTANFAPSAKDLDHHSAEEIVNDLIADHESAVRAMRKAATQADEAGDLVTSDMLTEHLTFHEKALWMLRATVAQ